MSKVRIISVGFGQWRSEVSPWAEERIIIIATVKVP